jgi:glucosamine--fructose-6-phosphate aminotransferase (isomerizing)
MVKKYGVRLLKISRSWNIYAGVDPERVNAPALILFPFCSNILCCGLAGILTVKQVEQPECDDPGKHMDALFESICREDISKILDGVISSGRYLNGSDTLDALKQCISTLKQGDAFERLFYNPRAAAHLMDLSKKMKLFLAEEQAGLENRAAHFSTGDLETINSRLTRMKDVCWALERDILDNIGRILRLTGSERPEDLTPEAFRKYRKINFLLNGLDRLEVRGRDSAGIQISLTLPTSLDFSEVLGRLKERGLYEDFRRRVAAGDLVNGSIECSETLPSLSFTYKTASIIG